nr:RNA-directed DNA polymerase, eukaryota [Tanacetum cinerariifolium]
MGSQRSKEDEVQKISTSVFVTNFPDLLMRRICGIHVSNMGRLLMLATLTEDQKQDIASLTNMKVVLGNEGFDNIELKYTGGYWIMIKFQSQDEKQMFQSNVGIGIWFYQLQQASTDFIIDGRITWVEIEGIPLKMCASVGNLVGILCVWDPKSFKKLDVTVSDYFVVIRGVWMLNGKNLLIILVYAPQESTEKKMLWDYLSFVMENWNDEVIIKGDFNEVRKKAGIFGLVFNVQGVDTFNMFISNARLEEVPLELDLVIDKREGDEDVVNKRSNVVKLLRDLEKLQPLKAAQKAKIKWAIEGDENTKYYHGILKKKESETRLHLDMDFTNNLNSDQRADLECEVTKDEIKKAV